MRLLIPEFKCNEYHQAVTAAFPVIKVDTFRIFPRRYLFSKDKKWLLRINGKDADSEDLADVTACIASNDLTALSTDYLVQRCPRLRWIHSRTTGVEHLLTPLIKARGISITRPQICSEAMGEYVLALILCVLKQFHFQARLQMDGASRFLPSRMLAGKKIGILGIAGHTGQNIAERLKSNGARIIGVGRTEAPKTEGPMDPYVPFSRMHTILPECDFVVIALPLTEETRGCFDARPLSLMKKDAWIINVGRGAIIDTRALIGALREMKIGGACLDLVEETQKGQIRRLRRFPNVLLTNHSSFFYPEYNRDNLNTFVEELKRYMAGQPLQNLVDVDKGY